MNKCICTGRSVEDVREGRHGYQCPARNLAAWARRLAINPDETKRAAIKEVARTH